MKLYWRIKKDGKWTWVAAQYEIHDRHSGGQLVTLLIPDLGDGEYEIEMP